MARTLASILSGNTVSYVPSTPSSMLKVAGLDVISIGEVKAPRLECHVREDGTVREAFFVRDGRLAGATLIGSRSAFATVRGSLGKDFDEVRAKLGL